MSASIHTEIKQYVNYCKEIIKNRDYNRILDQILIISIIFSVFFVAFYKIFTSIEDIVWRTNYLVLPDEIKYNLPFAYFIFLCIWITIKYTLNHERKTEEQEYVLQNLSFSIFKFRINISPNTLYTTLLIIVLASSIIIKAPYFDLPFVESHPMKYNTYAEPAFNMYKNQDPLFFKRDYMYNPLNPSEESAKYFGNLPLMEWSLYSGYTLLGQVFSMETITRIVTALWGIVALLSLYLFTKKAFSKEIALIATAIFTFNPIFNLASYVTVYDIITFPLTFFSLYFVLDFINKKNISIKYLALAALIIGIGASVKINILLWSVPITVMLLFYKYRRDYREFVKTVGYYLLWTVIPIIFVRTTVSAFPSKEIIYFLSAIAGIFVILTTFIKQDYIYKIYNNICNQILDLLNRYKFLYIIPTSLLLTFIIYVYNTDIAEEFLTDARLLLYSPLYERMTSEQLIPYTGQHLFLIFIFSLAPLLKVFKRIDYYSLLSLLTGIVIYIVLASKPLFFHNYYWIIILAPVYILISLSIIKISKYINSTSIKILFTVLFISTCILVLLPSTTSKINRNDNDIHSLIDYFNDQNLENGVSYIDQANSLYILFKTDLNTIYSTDIFDNEKFKEKVEEIGLIETMKYYKILYIVVPTGTMPNVLPIANAFDTEDKLVKNEIRRTDRIVEEITGKKAFYPDLKLREEIVENNLIQESFRIEEVVGIYTVYKVQDICLDFNTAK